MDRVAAHFTEAPDRRLAGAESADRQTRPGFATQLDNRPKSFDGSGPQFERGFFGDEFATISIVGIRQQGLDRHFDEFGSP